MQLRKLYVAVVVLGFLTIAAGGFTSGALAQQAPAAAPAAPDTVPPLMWREVWRQVIVGGGEANHVTRRVNPQSVTNPQLELKLYGENAHTVQVILHEGRQDLWTGMSPTPVAMMLRDRNNFADLTGLARLRAIVRTDSLHILYPAIKLADGTLLAGHRGMTTDGNFVMTEVAFNNMRWYRVDPKTVTTNTLVANPDLSRVDEVGFVELMPGGGAGTPGGWTNTSTMELYAKPVPR